jgi:basic membrane lipoprotein Med (substrate-binding protein (PBP1-ABC) superfamily)
MKLKQHWTFLLITFSAIVILLSGCEKKETVDLYTRHVEVVFAPNGIGDQGYNDNILAGLQQASVKYGFVLGIHMPQEKEQAKDI